MNKVYIYPKLTSANFILFRFRSVGMGNLLFPFARAIVYSNKFDLKLINPTWLQLTLGPYIRFQADKRHYHDLFHIVPNSIRGIKKILILMRYSWIKVDSNEKNEIKQNNKILTFEGIEDYFSPILKDHKLVKKTLLDIVRNKHKNSLNFNFKNSISIHVRLGDFKVGNQTTDINWFIEIINKLRADMGAQTKVYIFSDGTDKEIKDILNLNYTQRLSFGSSLADLLALSKSNVLIASKNSTFSWWASYLGRMPVIWHNSTNTFPIYYEDYSKEIFINDNSEIDIKFLSHIKKNYS